MKEQPVLTVESNVEPHSIDLTLSQVYSVLNWTTMEPAPAGKVRLRFSSGDYLTADRKDLKSAIRDLLSRERSGISASSAREARDLLDEELLGVRKVDHVDHVATSEMTVADLLALNAPAQVPFIFSPTEAAQVADLAEQAGYEQTAVLLRFLIDRAGGRYRLLLEDLVGPSTMAQMAWQTLQWNDLSRSLRLFLKRQLQKLGGMDGKELRSPEIYDEVVRALREDPGLSPNAFWKSIDDGDCTLYKSSDDCALYKSCEGGHEVLKHESNEKRGISFATLRRYFERARRSLPPKD